jgi:hypothetical protein
MPQGVIAALHLGGDRAAQSIGQQNALLSPPPVRLSNQIWGFVYLPVCAPSRLLSSEWARALFTFPDRLSLDCAF